MSAPAWAVVPTPSAEQEARITFAKPSGLADGDVIVVVLRSQGSTTGEITLPSGWARGGSGSVPSDRALGIFYKPVPSAASETATSYTFAGLSSGLSRIIGAIGVLRGADLDHLNDGGVAYDTDATLPATTAGGVPFTVVALWGAEFTSGVSVVPSAIPAGFTNVLTAQTAGGASPAPVAANSVTTGSRTGIVLASSTSEAGPTSIPSLVTTWPGSPTDPKSASWIVRGKTATPAQRGFNSVAEMAATPGATWAHRGGSASYPEHSLYAYQQAAQRGYGALEVSMQRTSDGVWFGCHDLTLARVTGNPALTADVRTMTWAEVNAHQIVVGAQGAPQPFMRWEDLLAAGFGDTHVLILDPKNSVGTHQAEFLAMVAGDVSPDRVLMKWSGGLTSFSDAARAAGFQTAGYWYQADYDANRLAAETPHWDWLGMDLTAGTAWTGPGSIVELAAAQGKNIWGHIAASQADYNTAVAKGSDVVQCAAVATIAPVSWWNRAGGDAVGTLTITGAASRTVAVTRTAGGALAVGGAAEHGTTVTRGAVGVLNATGTAHAVKTVSRGADGALSVNGTATRAVRMGRAAEGVLEVGGVGALGDRPIVRTATGTLDATGAAPRAVTIARTASGGLALGGIGTITYQVALTALGVLWLSGVGRIPATGASYLGDLPVEVRLGDALATLRAR